MKTLTAAVASAVLLTSVANAAGLGKLTVLSSLGQPLRAEIELTAVSQEEAANLVAKLASPEAYRAANVEFNPALLSLRFAVEQRGGRQFVRITSPQPLNEPFVDLLLELSWDNGRLVREYTFLLDPAELRSTQSAQVTPAPAANGRAARTGAASPATEAPRPQRAARADETAGEAASAAAASRYRVKSGDTLSRIAGKLKPVDVSLDMMLVALYRANPDAFIGNNMNRLKSGQILSVPGSDSLRGLDAGEAHGTVVAHAADFNAYRAKLAGQVATSAPAREAAAGQSATGRITAKVEERPTAANESQDQLRLSKATPARPSTGAATAEDVLAKEKELADAQTRVKELEKNVNDLENLITVKSQTGAAATQRAADAPATTTPPSTPLVPAAPTVVAQADTAPKAAPKIKTAPKPIAPEEPAETSLADTLMDNIVYLGAGAAVLLLAALGLSQRRKRKVVTTTTPNPPTILGNAAQPAQAMFAETGGQSVDTHDSVFNSSFAPSASQLDTNEVDPLAEAELYLAYNFDTQAEDILKEALRNDPYRHPVRLKLLEIYAARKDVRAFETQATELYSLSGGKGDEWAQAAALGHTLDPANPMYAQAAGMGGGAAVAAGAAGAAVAGAGLAAVTLDKDGGPQTMLSQQLEQAFRSRGDNTEIIEPAATVDAVTGAPLDKGFDLGSLGLDNDATALPQAVQADAKADDNLLDFDLGGLSFEPVAVAGTENAVHDDPTAVPDLQFDMEPFAPLEPASGTPAVTDSASLDELAFDMNFDTPAANAPASAPAAMPIDEDDAFVLDLSKSGPNTDIDMAQLAREFELPPLPEAPATPPASDLKDPLFDLDAMDFGMLDANPATPVTPVGAREEPVFDFGSTDLDLTPPGAEPLAQSMAQDTPAFAATQEKDPLFDLDMMDFGQPAAPAAPQDDPFALDEVPAIPNPGTPVPRFDLSGMDLDLPKDEFALTEPDAASVGAPAELSAAQMEMETKLDLAIAYQEIGDKEGARELLDEVIKGGNVEQSSRASAMRAQLA
ncbi:FimV/HubP family polar landmark protein [Massilia sp. Leaf139]|uniref:FimV/HubP family polar landmark protein n=1 Tax=Massilia sp. Leaf139 TaxID=1736272 RepID=UPI00138F3346|nr:FimV/HubP family polar landmark protein [Massilia sp. Leaf139]